MTDKEFDDTFSRTYGIDGSFLIANEYSFSFQALNSDTKDFFSADKSSDPAFYANLFRGSRTFNFQLFYNDVYPEFEAANGFLKRVDYREGGAVIWYDIRSTDSFIKLIQPSLYLTRMFNHDGEKIESYLAPFLKIETKGQNSIILRYYRQFEEFYGFKFNKNLYAAEISNKTFSWLFADLSALIGDGIYYDAIYGDIDPFLGYTHSLSLQVEFKPIKNWATQIKVQNYLFDGSQNSIKYRTNQDIYRIRSTFQFSREFALRFIIEHNNFYNDVDINALISYQPSPGTVFFLGYNDYYKEHNVSLNNRSYRRYSKGLFTKFSYLFRL